MSDRHPRAVTITLDRERSMLLDLNALAVLQQQCGINLFQSLGGTADNETTVRNFAERLLDPVLMRAVLWAALLRDDPTLTLEEVGTLCTDIVMVISKLTDLVAAMMGRDVPADPLATGVTATP